MENSVKHALAIMKTTLPAYFKGATDHTIRNRPVLKMIQQSGNILLNHKAPFYSWTVEVREMKPNFISSTGGVTRSFRDDDVYENLKIDAVQVEVTQMMNRGDQAINSNNPLAIVDIMSKKFDQMVKSMSNLIGKQFYADANANAQYEQLTGLDTFLKHNGADLTTDKILRPAAGAGYGGMSIELNSLGGWWSTNEASPYNTALANDWPFGQGSSEYDFNTPVLLNTNATWTGDAGWQNNCLKVLRRMARAMRHRAGPSQVPTVHILGSELRNQVEDKLEGRERVFVSDYAKSLGFPSTLVYEDAVIIDDFECPSNAGYAIHPENTALFSINDSLFKTDEGWDMPDQQSNMLVWFYGNYMQRPRCCGKYIAR